MKYSYCGCLMNLWKNWSKREERRGEKKTAIGSNENANDKLTSANAMQVNCTHTLKIKVNDQNLSDKIDR